VIVLDASVWVSSQLPDESRHRISLAWIDEQLTAGEFITIPVLFLAEVAGSLARRTGDAAGARRGVNRILSDPQFTVEPTDILINLVIDSAIIASLRGVDAVYVALARHLEAPLVTWDREIGRKAGHLIDVREPTSATG